MEPNEHLRTKEQLSEAPPSHPLPFGSSLEDARCWAPGSRGAAIGILHKEVSSFWCTLLEGGSMLSGNLVEDCM